MDMTAAAEALPGWNDFAECVQTLPQRMLQLLPEDRRSDPHLVTKIERMALEAVASQVLGWLGSDGDHPQFMPAIGQVLNVGQPNADTVYRSASITPGGIFRLRGERGSLRIAVISEVGHTPRAGGQSGPHKAVHDINSLSVDGDDRFDVILSVERPMGYEGDWWALSPSTNMLMMRLVSCAWATERSPTIAIERLDVAPQRPRPTADMFNVKLRGLRPSVEFLALMFVNHHEKLRAEGYINKLKAFDLSDSGGLTGQFYYEGAYELADDEALIVEVKMPGRCHYRSLILTNEIYQTTDWYNNHASLNDVQAPTDADGILRIVISAGDPGVANWLDTAGYGRGVIQGRWTDCDSQPIPTVARLKLSDVRNCLPAGAPSISPAERARIIRDRRAALLERPLW